MSAEEMAVAVHVAASIQTTSQIDGRREAAIKRSERAVLDISTLLNCIYSWVRCHVSCKSLKTIEECLYPDPGRALRYRTTNSKNSALFGALILGGAAGSWNMRRHEEYMTGKTHLEHPENDEFHFLNFEEEHFALIVSGHVVQSLDFEYSVRSSSYSTSRPLWKNLDSKLLDWLEDKSVQVSTIKFHPEGMKPFLRFGASGVVPFAPVVKPSDITAANSTR